MSEPLCPNSMPAVPSPGSGLSSALTSGMDSGKHSDSWGFLILTWGYHRIVGKINEVRHQKHPAYERESLTMSLRVFLMRM